MIKKFIITGMLCLFATSINAQKKPLSLNLQPKEDTSVSPIVKEKIEEYATKIHSIIQVEKNKMEADLKMLQEKSLTKADFDKEKAQIADSYSEKIDSQIENLGFDLDHVIQKQVRYSLLNSDITSNEDLRKELLAKFRPTKNLEGYFSYGIMVLTNDKPDNDLDKNLGYSNNLEFGLKFNYQFGRTSPWGLISGLGFSWRTIRPDNNLIFAKDNHDVILTKYDGGLDKAKLRTGYIMVPLGLQYNFSKIKNAGMDVQYRPYSNGFRVGANVYGGVRMSTQNIVKGDGKSIRDRSNYNVNPFVYGAQFTISYNNISLFVKKDLNNTFKDSYFENDKSLIFGLALGW